MSRIVVPSNIENNLTYLLPSLASATFSDSSFDINSPTSPGAKDDKDFNRNNPAGPGSNPSGPGSNPSGPGSNPSGPGSNPSGPGSSPSGPGSNPSGPGSNSSGPGSNLLSAGSTNLGKGFELSNYGHLMFPFLCAFASAIIVSIILQDDALVPTDFSWSQKVRLMMYLLVVYLTTWLPAIVKLETIVDEPVIFWTFLVPIVCPFLVWFFLFLMNIHRNYITQSHYIERIVWTTILSFLLTLVPVVTICFFLPPLSMPPIKPDSKDPDSDLHLETTRTKFHNTTISFALSILFTIFIMGIWGYYFYLRSVRNRPVVAPGFGGAPGAVVRRFFAPLRRLFRGGAGAGAGDGLRAPSGGDGARMV